MTTYLMDYTHNTDVEPITYSKHFTGFVGDDTNTYEVEIDNAKLQVHCHEVQPPDDWTCMDLTDATFFTNYEFTTHPGADWTSGQLVSGHIVEFGGIAPSFYFSGFTLDPTKTYEFRATFDSGSTPYFFGIMQENPALTFFSDNDELYYQFDGPGTRYEWHATVGPGLDDWDQAITDDYQTMIRFDTSNGSELISLCYKEV